MHLVQLEDSRMSLNWNSLIKNKEHVWGPWAEPNVMHETQTLFFTIGWHHRELFLYSQGTK